MATCEEEQKTYCTDGVGKIKSTFDHAKMCIEMKTDTKIEREDWEKKIDWTSQWIGTLLR